jgi:fatty acid desaturase
MKNVTSVVYIREWPTWLIIVSVYTVWWLVLLNFESLPFAPVMLVIVLGFHGSVQHELLHGHPSHNQTLNDFLAYPPLALWYPYPVYKNSHLTHHENVNLTIPGVDPESYYVSEKQWNNLSNFRQQLALFNMTILGRLFVAPLWHFINLNKQCIESITSKSSREALVWVTHAVLVLGLLLLVGLFFKVNLFIYIACAYFSQSVILLRSFYEHRADNYPNHRSIIMKAALPMRLLFLNNNYHSVHHENPGMSWYQLPNEYKSNRNEYDNMNGNFIESGYYKWILKYLLRPIDHPKHKGF